MHKGKEKVFDLSNPEAYLSEYGPRVGKKVLVGLMKDKQKVLGKEMAKDA